MSDTVIEPAVNQDASPKARLWRRPRYDVSESAEAFQVQVFLPGVNRESVEVEIEKDVLSVEATRLKEIPEGWKALRRESTDGDFRLKLELNSLIDREGVAAEVKDGVLSLRLPKVEEAKPKKITIN